MLRGGAQRPLRSTIANAASARKQHSSHLATTAFCWYAPGSPRFPLGALLTARVLTPILVSDAPTWTG